MMRTTVAAALAACLWLASGCADRQKSAPAGRPSGKLIVFHAGSLAVPFREIVAGFKREYPEVKVICEAAGSRACARKIVDLNRACDVMASADYTVIDTLLIPDHAEWNIKFAGNEMAIAYRDGSRRADQMGQDNWYEILLKDDVAFGRSDPNADPCGYRAALVVKLAEKHYKAAGLAERLLKKDLRYIRPKETDLLALLETGTIDYVFLYRSVAEQHGLRRLLLPDEVNLKKSELGDWYASVAVEISGKDPGSVITKRGEPMVYGVTIPTRAPNREAAIAFVAFLLSESKGMSIMARNGQPPLVPAPTDTFAEVPPPLKKFAAEPK
jgi:molybdate/tungstate transport system substrate-binding protein